MTRAAMFVAEFSHRLRGLTEPEMVLFTRFTRMFAARYAFAYKIYGDIDLVLDNSIIQAFKHRNAEPGRALRALAFVAFCRFVTDWSDRPTSLAISPFAIYEHSGRKLAANKHEAGAILCELGALLAETGLSAAGIGFTDTSALFHQLADIQHDEAYLTRYVGAIDAASWETKLSRSCISKQNAAATTAQSAVKAALVTGGTNCCLQLKENNPTRLLGVKHPTSCTIRSIEQQEASGGNDFDA